MLNVRKLLIVFLKLVLHFEYTNSKGDLPVITSASILESLNNPGVNVTYTDDMELWSDLQKLLKVSSVKTPTTICVRGAWLVYSKPEFRTDEANDVHVFSGNNNCVKPTNMSQIGAMQPIGPYRFQKQSITVFEKELFGSFGLSYSPSGTEVKKFRKPWLPTLDSLVTFGKSSWTLVDISGKTVCVKPIGASDTSICLASSLSNYGLPKGLQFVGVAANCIDHKVSNLTEDVPPIELKDCKEFGSPKLEKITYEKKIKPVALGRAMSGCPEPDTDDMPLKEDIIRKLTKLRFTHDFSANQQLLWPERKEDIWKTEIMDTLFDVMIATCPDEVVPTTYLQIIRELLTYNLDKSWKTSKTKSSLSTKDFDVMALKMNKCLGQARQQMPQLRDRIIQSYKSIRNKTELTEAIYAAFVPNPKFDLVIDSAWIVANYALALCHHLGDYDVDMDFWAEYIDVIKEFYFAPLMSRWQTPKDLSFKAYSAILGGFGTDVQFQRMGFCASMVFDFTPNMVPFEKNFS